MKRIVFLRRMAAALLVLMRGMSVSVGVTAKVLTAEAEAGDRIIFGHYEQDNNTANGKEPIEWLVLKVDESTNRALLLSRYGLDARAYRPDAQDADDLLAWANSEMRGWMNSSFLNEAFTEAEQRLIAVTTVKTEENAEWMAICEKQNWGYKPMNGGTETQDKVFLLSLEEAMEYGGYSTVEEFFSGQGSEKLTAMPTAYAIAQGAKFMFNSFDINAMLNGQGFCIWWLRSPGGDAYSAFAVISNGGFTIDAADFEGYSVRPALWLDLEVAFAQE